jgi:hypothetical protein
VDGAEVRDCQGPELGEPVANDDRGEVDRRERVPSRQEEVEQSRHLCTPAPPRGH